jgi:hypothetical protein
MGEAKESILFFFEETENWKKPAPPDLETAPQQTKIRPPHELAM